MRPTLALLSGLLMLGAGPALSQPAPSAETCIRQAQSSSGKINHVRQARCLNQINKPALLARIGHPDLVDYLQTKNVTIAENIDRGRITPIEGAAQTQEATARAVSEAQRRNRSQVPMAAQQSQTRGVTFCNTLGVSTVCY